MKHDAVDAKTLAHLLRAAILREAWMAPPEVREARCLVRVLRWFASGPASRVGSTLFSPNTVSTSTDIFGPGGRTKLVESKLRPMVTRRIEPPFV